MRVCIYIFKYYQYIKFRQFIANVKQEVIRSSFVRRVYISMCELSHG